MSKAGAVCLSVCLPLERRSCMSGRGQGSSFITRPQPLRPLLHLQLPSQHLGKLKGVTGFWPLLHPLATVPFPGDQPLACERVAGWLHRAPMGLLDVADQQTARSGWHITSLSPLPPALCSPLFPSLPFSPLLLLILPPPPPIMTVRTGTGGSVLHSNPGKQWAFQNEPQ